MKSDARNFGVAGAAGIQLLKPWPNCNSQKKIVS